MTIVLAAVDSGPSVHTVLSAAVALADLYGSEVTALHVGLQASAGVTALARSMAIPLREAAGAPVEQIISAARAPEVEALVLGARGVIGGPRPAGHAALEVITHMTKPVALVPPDARPSELINRMLVPVEGAGARSPALDHAIGLAHRLGRQVLVLHVLSESTVPAFSDHAPHAGLAWEREFLTRCVPPPRDNVTLLRRLGVPGTAVVAIAHEVDAELIVLTWSQDLGPGRARVVSETLARSDVPVLLLPSGRPSPVPRVAGSPESSGAAGAPRG